MNEFDLINTCFAPLAKNFPGSLALTDDAALITPPSGSELVITKDALSAGVHFIGDEDAALIARKALRTNLSDLAAMGAQPLCYFLALLLPRDTAPQWIQRFAEGLKEDQAEFGIHLAGGDTTATGGPLSLSITALGHVPTGTALRRSGAKAGDIIFVSGTLGDSALGLHSTDEALRQRYLLPQPRLALGQRLRGIANACMDISDGLVQDMGHICTASKVGATLMQHRLPLSATARATPGAIAAALSGGDDYELLFTVSPEKKASVAALATELQLPLTAIGEITAGNGVQVVDENGAPVIVAHKGFQHFS